MKRTMYEMVLDFSLKVTLNNITDMLNCLGIEQNIGALDIGVLHLKETLPIIPSEEMIANYEKVIKENYKTEKFTTVECKFKGFSKIKTYEIDVPDTDIDANAL